MPRMPRMRMVRGRARTPDGLRRRSLSPLPPPPCPAAADAEISTCSIGEVHRLLLQWMPEPGDVLELCSSTNLVAFAQNKESRTTATLKATEFSLVAAEDSLLALSPKEPLRWIQMRDSGTEEGERDDSPRHDDLNSLKTLEPSEELNAAKSGINIALLTSALDDAREERDRLAENENVMQNKFGQLQAKLADALQHCNRLEEKLAGNIREKQAELDESKQKCDYLRAKNKALEAALRTVREDLKATKSSYHQKSAGLSLQASELREDINELDNRMKSFATSHNHAIVDFALSAVPRVKAVQDENFALMRQLNKSTQKKRGIFSILS